MKSLRYVTAQRVRTKGGLEGTNTFVYDLSAESLSPDGLYNRIVQGAAKCRLRAEDLEVIPGGNRVLSSIDIITPANASPEGIDEAVAGISAALKAGKATRLTWKLESCEVEFSVAEWRDNLGSKELQHLANHALGLLANPKPPAQLGDDPLTAAVAFENGGIHVDLSDASKDRIRRYGRGPEVVTPLTLSTSRALFEANPRPHLRQRLLELTGLTVDELIGEGGIRFVDAATGRSVWAWPSSQAAAK